MQRPEKNAEMTHAASYYLMPEAKRVLDPGIFTLHLLLLFNLPPSPFAIPFACFLTIQHWTSTQPSVACNCHHTHSFNGPLSRTTQVSVYQKGKTNLDFTEARDSEWQWHQLGYMQVCTSLQTDNHASVPPLSFLQAGCPSCCPTNSVKALKAIAINVI